MPIYKVGEYWYARIEKGGKKWTPKKVGMTKARWKRKSEAKLGEAELRQKVERLRITQTSLDLLTLCNEYLKDARVSHVGHDTFAGKHRLCRELLETWGNIACEDITVHMAQSYLLNRAERVSNNSFNVYRQEGIRLFRWGVKQEFLPRDFRNPFAEIDKKRYEKSTPGPAPIEHVVRAYRVATPDLKDLLLSYLITGGRKSEILTWEWSDIDFKNQIYALHTRKSGTGELKTTYHEMPELLYQLLKRRFINRHPTLPYVFWHRFWDKKKGDWRVDRYQSLNKFTKRLCKKAGVPPFHLHQLRHLASTILKERGNMGLAKLQRFLRHDKQKTTEVYAGHLETGTKEQTDFLADFWENTLDGKGETSSKSSSEQNKKG
jgi:integrase